MNDLQLFIATCPACRDSTPWEAGQPRPTECKSCGAALPTAASLRHLVCGLMLEDEDES